MWTRHRGWGSRRCARARPRTRRAARHRSGDARSPPSRRRILGRYGRTPRRDVRAPRPRPRPADLSGGVVATGTGRMAIESTTARLQCACVDTHGNSAATLSHDERVADLDASCRALPAAISIAAYARGAIEIRHGRTERAIRTTRPPRSTKMTSMANRIPTVCTAQQGAITSAADAPRPSRPRSPRRRVARVAASSTRRARPSRRCGDSTAPGSATAPRSPQRTESSGEGRHDIIRTPPAPGAIRRDVRIPDTSSSVSSSRSSMNAIESSVRCPRSRARARCEAWRARTGTRGASACIRRKSGAGRACTVR